MTFALASLVALLALLAGLAVLMFSLWWLARSERAIGWAAAVTAVGALFVAGRMLLHLGLGPPVAIIGVRVQVSAGILFGPIVLLAAESIALRPGWSRAMRVVSCAALALMGAEWLTDGTRPYERVARGGTTYWDVQPGPLTPFFAVGLAAVMLHAYRILGKRAAEGPEQALHRRFRLLAIFLVLLMVNNFADSAGLIHTAQLVDFGIATIAIAISTSLLQRFVRMHVHLEAEVASRTADLALKEASFRLLIEMSPESILIESGARVTFANRTALAFFGCATAEQLTSRPMVQLVEPRARPAFEAWLRARTLVSRATSLHEASFVRLDGSIVTGELVAIELLLDGAPSVVTMIRDVSERQRMLAKLRFADRMTSLGTLSAGMAHEINNPLAAVVANVEMARKVTRSEPAPLGSSAHMELEAMLTDAAEGADRVRSIVRGLKAFSRADEETIGHVDPREVLESAIRLVQNEVRHRATLVRAYEPTSPALGNAARLEQVLVNLLVNAAQAISVGAADRNAIRVVTRMDGDEWVVLEVHDSGCGIEPALKHRIFDPFFTTKAIGVGTGLGLSVCHGIVSAFGGRIEVESTRGSGSRFCVYLPAAPTAHVIAPGPPKSADIVGRLRVLIVDDETLVARALRRVLSDHEVVVASDGREALEACAVGRFNLILCDVMVPEMTGIEVYRAIARDYPGREEQIVFVSGGVFSGEANDLLEGMPNLMLEKPIGTAELTAVLRRAAVGESFRNPT